MTRSDRRTARARADAGFTLVELLVVMVILGLLASIAAPQVLGYLDRSRSDAAQLQIRRLDSILELYRLDIGRYPTTEEGLAALRADPGDPRWRGPYVKGDGDLVDPWGAPWAYRAPGREGPYEIVSLGGDGQPGGEGIDADIVGGGG
jgi:general secretion pathway protein G